MNSDQCLEVLQKICEIYTCSDKYVYKSCFNLPDEIEIREWLVVLEKLDDTITNETRSNAVDKQHAKFRADKLKVIKIVNMKNPMLTKTHIVNEYNLTKTKYEVDKVTCCDKYDHISDNVCSYGNT